MEEIKQLYKLEEEAHARGDYNEALYYAKLVTIKYRELEGKKNES